MSNKNPVLSGFIRMRRTSLGVTRKELGKALKMGASGVCCLELGKTRLLDRHFYSLADILQVNPIDLMNLKSIDLDLNSRY